MMTRRDISLTIALCASMIMHALLLGGAAELYTRKMGGHIWLPGFTVQPDPQGIVVVPAKAEDDPYRRLGDSTGRGSAILGMPGEQPMQAQQGSQDQPFLSLDPAGPGHVGDDPTDSMLPPARNAAPQELTPPEAVAMAAQPAPLGLNTPAGDFAGPFNPRPGTSLDKPTPGPADTPDAPPPDSQAPQPGADQVQAAGAQSAADPAPQGDSESDPIATVGSAEFSPGKTDVRLGRKFKLIRPRLTLAAQADLVTKPTHSVVLKIRIDDTGKVTAADIYRSSGSNSIDQPCKLAAYNWWFEPLKDAQGQPIKDVILFSIRFI